MVEFQNNIHSVTDIIFFMCCPTEALKTIVGAAVAGVSVLSLCEKGDAFIMAETGKIFKKEKEMKKGESSVAFYLSLSMSIMFLVPFTQPVQGGNSILPRHFCIKGMKAESGVGVIVVPPLTQQRK